MINRDKQKKSFYSVNHWHAHKEQQVDVLFLIFCFIFVSKFLTGKTIKKNMQLLKKIIFPTVCVNNGK